MKVICTKTKATVEKDELPVEGRVGLVCTFEFSSEWSGLAKSATLTLYRQVKNALKMR